MTSSPESSVSVPSLPRVLSRVAPRKSRLVPTFTDLANSKNKKEEGGSQGVGEHNALDPGLVGTKVGTRQGRDQTGAHVATRSPRRTTACRQLARSSLRAARLSGPRGMDGR